MEVMGWLHETASLRGLGSPPRLNLSCGVATAITYSVGGLAEGVSRRGALVSEPAKVELLRPTG